MGRDYSLLSVRLSGVDMSYGTPGLNIATPGGGGGWGKLEAKNLNGNKYDTHAEFLGKAWSFVPLSIQFSEALFASES